MGFIVNKNMEEGDELARRISADLREKQMKSQELDAEQTDFTENTDYMKDTKRTGKWAWVWIAVAAVAVVAAVIIVVYNNK